MQNTARLTDFKPPRPAATIDSTKQPPPIKFKASPSLLAPTAAQSTAAAPSPASTSAAAPSNKGKKRSRSVSFAPGPAEVAAKYNTADGHPDHEGQTARQRRRVRRPATEDLTPDAIKAIEQELGEECKHSIVRLKRRAGLLPLRGPPATFLKWLTRQTADLGDAKYAASGNGSGGGGGGSSNNIPSGLSLGFRLKSLTSAGGTAGSLLGAAAAAANGGNKKPLRLGSLRGPGPLGGGGVATAVSAAAVDNNKTTITTNGTSGGTAKRLGTLSSGSLLGAAGGGAAAAAAAAPPLRKL